MIAKQGHTYLYIKDDISPIWTFFSDLVNSGMRGFAITKVNPNIIKEKYSLNKTPICQISFDKKTDGMPPDDPSAILRLIKYISKLDGEFIILIDGIEFFISTVGFKRMFSVMKTISGTIANNSIIVIFTATPSFFESDDRATLTAAFQQIDNEKSDEIGISMRFGDIIFVGIGDIQVTKAPFILSTYLGSCVGVSLYDTKTKIGGMAHIVLPYSRGSNEKKYADIAIPYLINKMKEIGANTSNLECNIAGGAKAFKSENDSIDIGSDNLKVVKNLLAKYKIKIIKEFLGIDSGVKIILDTETGDVSFEKLNQTATNIDIKSRNFKQANITQRNMNTGNIKDTNIINQLRGNKA